MPRPPRERLDELAAAIPGVVYQFLVDSSGEWRFVYVSPGVERLFEVTPEEACADHDAMTSLIVSEDRQSHRASVEHSFRTLSPWRHEHRIRPRSGALKWVRAQATPEAQPDGSVLWHGVLLDVTESKEGEETLRRAEAFQQAVLDSISAEIAVVDRAGVIRAVNQRWQRFAFDNGLEPGKPAPRTQVGASYFDACGAHAGPAADGAQEAREGIQAVLEGRLESFTLDYPCHSPREQRWFTMNVTPLGEGAARGAVVAHTNITKRKQLEVALTDANERFNQFMDALPAAALIKSEDGEYLYLNQHMRTVMGLAFWHGRRTRDLLPPVVAERVEADDRAALEQGRRESVDQVSIGDGTLREYEIRKFRIPRVGQPPLLGAIALDVTEQRRIAKELRADREILGKIAMSSPVGIVVVPRSGRITFANAAAEAILGLAKNASDHSYDDPSWKPTDLEGNALPADRLPISLVLVSGQPVHGIEHGLETRDGRWILVSVNAAPLFDEQGAIDGVVAAFADITERKRQQDALVERNEALERKTDELEAALGHVKRLEGLLPICMSCKKIRTPGNDWQQLERFIVEHSDAAFSHGLCPECLGRQMKELD